ncbi:MarR family transcriptional regulator [Nocardioides fonticola]|uniref:MarR family transcriptional regulator n=1 Tax=Nocardioides fonticola TaxID=450363 RepID=A0ABP7X9Z4_9ACTN
MTSGSRAEPQWLSPDEQAIWRDWLAVTSLLPAALQRALHADAGLSLPDFDVLVLLSETDGGRLRVSELARALTWERSRASHHLSRMEKRGLVAREECEDDGRGWFVVLTAAGRDALERAVPGHVDTVRSLFLDPLPAGGDTGLADALAALRTGLERSVTNDRIPPR